MKNPELNEFGVRLSENELLRKILYLSNTDYCESSKDMQYSLENINELIKESFPDLDESND